MLNSSEQGTEEKELQERLEREYPYRKETFTQSNKQQSSLGCKILPWESGRLFRITGTLQSLKNKQTLKWKASCHSILRGQSQLVGINWVASHNLFSRWHIGSLSCTSSCRNELQLPLTNKQFHALPLHC